MSVTITGRVFWTEMNDLSYVEKKGEEVIRVSASSAKVVLLAIADSADDFGENSYNSLETLATKSSLKRRSVIRVIRALIENGYIIVSGVSVYGTNNFKVIKDKLGNSPEKRAKVGRPQKEIIKKTGDSTTKTSDSGANIGDSTAKTSDSASPDPSLSSPNPPLSDAEMQKIISEANASFDKELELMRLSAGKSWTKLPEAYHAYGKAFCAATGLEYVKKNLYEWIGVFEEWNAQSYMPQDVIAAVQAITDEGRAGTISAPRSITHKLNGIKVARITRERALQAKAIPEENGEPDWREAWALEQANRENVNA